MKIPTRILRLGAFAAVLLTVTPTLTAQDTRYFRITGPAATTITELRADGTLVWSNAQAGTNYIVQTTTSLPGGTNWVDYVQLPVTNSVNTNLLVNFSPPAGMALIPAGSFTMGNCMSPSEGQANELPLHTVYVSSFYMDKYHVTFALWKQVYNWATNHGYGFDFAGSGTGNHPVQTVDWYDCVKWCNARSEIEGKTPAYYTSAAQTTVYRTGLVAVFESSVKWNAGYRLPTEAEWEKAARGGASGLRFPFGNTVSWSRANYYGYSLSLTPSGYAYDFATAIRTHPAFGTTSPVNYFAPNGYGLYDMAGNVWQWCWDRYGDYSSAPQTDPRGPAYGPGRVDRGGSYDLNASYCRSAFRDYTPPTTSYKTIGFRSVLSPDQ